MVRVVRIELTTPAWKVGVLPLNYTRTKMSKEIDFCLLVKCFPCNYFWKISNYEYQIA